MINKIVITSIWFFMVAFFLIYCPTAVDSISKVDMNKITTGMDAGAAIAGLLGNKKFVESLSKIATDVGPYLGAIGPCIAFISAFNPSESAELKQMKKMMRKIDSRLDHLDHRLSDIERSIKWSSTKDNFGVIEQKIMTISHDLENMYNAPPSAVENVKNIFIMNYESDYTNSGMKLYNSIVKDHGTFIDNLGTAILLYTKHDRKQTQTFLMGVMQLLLQAVKVEITYFTVMKYTYTANQRKLLWTNRTQEVVKKFKDIDVQCIINYPSKSVKDIDEYSAKHQDQTNKQFATGLFNLLNTKYYWRDWMVIAYNPIRGYQNHCVSISGVYYKFRKYGRNLLVASVDKNQPHMTNYRGLIKNSRVSMSYRSGNWFTGYKRYRRRAEDIFDSLDKTGFAQVSVIRCNADIGYEVQNRNRLVLTKRCPAYYWLFMFG